MKSEIIRILLIDDEKAVCSICRNYLSNRNDIVILGECATVKEAEILINTTQPDVILLDINLKDGTGFDLLSNFPKPTFKIIFISTHQQYALAAIKAGALDYILKPIEEAELLNAIEKVCGEQKNTNPIQLDVVKDYLNGQAKRLIVRTFEAMHIIRFDELIYCHSDNGYTTFYLTDRPAILVSKSIKDYEHLLPSAIFVRTHQSYLVNIYFVQQVKRDFTLVLKNRIEIPVSVKKKDKLIKLLDEILKL